MLKIPSPELLKTICKCQDCHLHEFAEHPYVGGRWYNEKNHPEIPLLITIGEAPGKWEDKAGACFQNTSLKNLEKALGDNLNNCYLTNVCRCVPWEDSISRNKVRKPTPLEMECCLPWLLLEISKFPEKTPIVAMGATAFSALMPSMKEARITEIAGTEYDLEVHGKHYRLFAQVHPASISYNPSLSEKFFSVFNSILNKVTGEEIAPKESEYWEILNPSKAIEKMKEAKQLYLDGVIKYVVTDTETSGLLPWKDRIIMFGLSHTNDPKGYSIPMEIQNRVDFPNFPTEIYPIDFEVTYHDAQIIKETARDLFNTVPIVGHNLKFDIKMMAFHNYLNLNKVKVYNDTMMMSAVLIGRKWKGDSIGLKEMSQKVLGLEQSWDWVIDEWLKKYKRVADRTFDNIPTCILGKYCALDHFYTRELHEKLFPMIEKHLCGEIINALNIATVAYSEAELKGIDIDWDVYKLVKTKSDALIEDINKRILRDPHIKKMMMEKYEKDIKENSLKKRPKDNGVFYQKLIDGEYFSLGSVKDKRELIYNRYNVPVTNLTDKGEPSTDRESITAIAKETEDERLKNLCHNMLEYNKFSKLKSTYIDNLPDNCDDNNVYHCEFNIAGTVTGRLSSNFHVLPRKSDVKYLYTSKNYKDTGSIWLSPDMSQLELRVTAGIANETSWIESYREGIDLHTKTAAEMFHNGDIAKVSKDDRKIGKTQNFALLYGVSAESQAGSLGISVEEAREMMEKHKSTIPNIVNLVKRQEAFATKHGFIWNMFNRYMPVPDAQSPDKKIKAHGLRESFNYLIQSTGSDIVMTSFTRMYQDIKRRKMCSLMYGTVHDSIETSAYDYELISIINMFKYHFETENNQNLAWMNGCPLVLSLEFGTSWGASVEFEPDEYDWNHVTLKTSGLECNVNKLVSQLQKCYNVDMKEIGREELTDDDFGSEDFIRDTHKIEIEMTVSNREGHKVQAEV